MQGCRVTSRRAFVAVCACAGCVGVAGAAEPSGRNIRSLKDAAAPAAGADTGSEAAQRTFDVAFCGIYCAACERHLTGNKEGKKCKGCTHPSMESKCAIFACAKDKKVANCGLCEQFESCEKLSKHHAKPLYRQAARRTCLRIKEKGMDTVLAEQKERWTCKACGKLFPWNVTGVCPHCGKAIAALCEKDA